jgi:flagellar basal body-associated protein FliL
LRVTGGEILAAAGAVLGAVITAWGSWAAGRKHEQTRFITAVQEAAHLVIVDLRQEIDRVVAARVALEAQHAHCQHELAALRDRLDALDASQTDLFPGR